MFRIGIIGTESSHALAFAKILNAKNPDTGEYDYPDVRVVAVYGPDHVSENEICAQAEIPYIAQNPKEFFGRVDAVMITSRKGSQHAFYAMPFIEQGMPVFVDKPFTADVREAKALIEKAKNCKALLTGGSGCKYASDVLILKNDVETLISNNEFLTGCITYAADKNSEYDGFFFYAPHLTEMALTIFGYDMCSVKAYERENIVTVIVRYNTFDITLYYAKDVSDIDCIIIGKKANYYRKIDISMIYSHEVQQFVQMLRTGVMPMTYEQLMRHTEIISGIITSMTTGKEIQV
ncbi:MAG: Gfo/Idh/MocA family oxidoreductase [Ruthenibacterium sp.]